MNLNPAVRARWLANLGGVVLVTVIKEVDPKLLPFLTFARCQEPSLWTTTGWPAKHCGCNSHFVQRQTTNTVIGSPSPSPIPPRVLSFNSQRHPKAMDLLIQFNSSSTLVSVPLSPKRNVWAVYLLTSCDAYQVKGGPTCLEG